MAEVDFVVEDISGDVSCSSLAEAMDYAKPIKAPGFVQKQLKVRIDYWEQGEVYRHEYVSPTEVTETEITTKVQGV